MGKVEATGLWNRLLSRCNDLIDHYRLALVIAVYATSIVIAYYFAFFIRFDLSMPFEYFQMFWLTLPFIVIARISAYLYYGVFFVSFSYADINDLWDVLKSQILGTFVFMLLLVFWSNIYRFPRSIFVLELSLSFVIISGLRYIRGYLKENAGAGVTNPKKYVAIIGAGRAGVMVLNEIRGNRKLGISVTCFIDDDPYKRGTFVRGVPVLGTCADVPELIRDQKIDEIIIAMPSVPRKEIMRIADSVKKAEVKVSVVPGLDKIISGSPIIGQLTEIPMDLILGRNVVKFSRESDRELLEEDIRGRVALVTGAGGSIGSELCLQISGFSPSLIIAYERHENSLFELELQMRKVFPSQPFLPIIGDILDVNKIDGIMARHKVDIVYHAAAYKHVPMMEREPVQAVRNNVFGTLNLVETASRNHVGKFVLISTDKAVNPTSIMGTTKRIAELIVQSRSPGATKFIAVRFGNVLQSNGSVIPVFQKQIEEGGPVTVTDPEVTRYFMSIPEAVQLVLIAGAMGKGGEIFLLDMGKPIKITELAMHLIRQSGLEPGKDIEIVYTGLRKGEKLNEELYWIGEGIVPTRNKKITMLRPDGKNGADRFSAEDIARLKHSVETDDRELILKQMKEIVPESTIDAESSR